MSTSNRYRDAVRADSVDLDAVDLDPDTNPWIEVDGEPVGAIDPHALEVVGILTGCDDGYGVQRDDESDRYDSDVEAALALAEAIGGVAYVLLDEEA